MPDQHLSPAVKTSLWRGWLERFLAPGSLARKLMGRLISSRLTFSQRLEAFFHLTPHFAYPLLVLLSVLLLPALLLMPATSNLTMFLVDLPLLSASTGSLAAFYMEAERAQGRHEDKAKKAETTSAAKGGPIEHRWVDRGAACIETQLFDQSGRSLRPQQRRISQRTKGLPDDGADTGDRASKCTTSGREAALSRALPHPGQVAGTQAHDDRTTRDDQA